MSPVPTQAVLYWLKEKLFDAKKSLLAREQMAKAWRSGTSKTWQSVGCTMSRKERIEESLTQNRIAAKCRRDVVMLGRAIELLLEKQ